MTTQGLRKRHVPGAKSLRQIQRLRPPLLPGRDYDYFAYADRAPFDENASSFSLVNAWWLAELSLLSYVRDGASVKREIEKTPFELEALLSQDRGSLTKGFILSTSRCVVAIFRGTDVADPIDWMNDLDTRWATFDAGGRVHAGFARALETSGSWARIERLLDKSHRRIHIAGHSLGGAVAQLAGARLHRHHRSADCQLYTFGAPRVGDRKFVDHLPDRHFRVVNHRDPTPKVPPFRGFVHGGKAVWLDAHGKPGPLPRDYDHGAARKLGAWLRSHDTRRKWASLLRKAGPWAPFADHMPVMYTTHLWNAYVDDVTSQKMMD